MRRITCLIPAAALALAVLLPALVPAPAAAQQANTVRGPVQKPVPMQILDSPPPNAAQPAEGQSKFKNIDTAKNRKDYEMGTDAPGIHMGRDEDSGDTVMGHTPPKQKPQPQNAFEGQPIQVKPIIIPK